MVKIAVLKETAAGETRVSASPETVKKFIALGASVSVENDAGASASIGNSDYESAGASVGSLSSVLKDADIILGVQGPEPKLLASAPKGAWVVASLDPFGQRARVDAYAKAGVDALAMDFMPRITRAQSMDILSSQSNLAGYKAVIDAAAAYGRAFPMMMTAAGTISAARAFIMGVGVAGLQAIATARRLGAQVSATDVRSATKEQIESLGAKAIFVEDVAGIEGEGAGGYATEMSDEYKAAQAELVSAHIAKQDIVITTAKLFGKKPPMLVPANVLDMMRPGSVVIDMACMGDNIGNVEGSRYDEVVVTAKGVKVYGGGSLERLLPTDASEMYAANVANFFEHFYDAKAQTLKVDPANELLKPMILANPNAVTA